MREARPGGGGQRMLAMETAILHGSSAELANNRLVQAAYRGI